MDLDALINIILLCIFLVISALARRQKAKKQAKAVKPVKPRKKSRFAFIENIREQLRQYAEELERQARQQKREAEPDFWTELAREESVEQADSQADSDIEIAPRPIPVPDAQQPDTPCPATKSLKHRKRRMACERISRFQDKECPRSPVADIPLRQAVIWSEIIGKPVALRDE